MIKTRCSGLHALEEKKHTTLQRTLTTVNLIKLRAKHGLEGEWGLNKQSFKKYFFQSHLNVLENSWNGSQQYLPTFHACSAVLAWGHGLALKAGNHGGIINMQLSHLGSEVWAERLWKLSQTADPSGDQGFFSVAHDQTIWESSWELLHAAESAVLRSNATDWEKGVHTVLVQVFWVILMKTGNLHVGPWT